MHAIYIDLLHKKKLQFRTAISVSLICVLACLASCKKNKFAGGNPAVLQVFNAIDDQQNLYINLKESRPAQFVTNGLIANHGYAVQNNMFVLTGTGQQVQFYSQQDTMPHDKPLLSTSFETVPGSSYWMLLFGSPSNVEFTLVKEEYPSFNKSEPAFAVKFSNISEANPVSINIKGQAAGSLVQQLPFKSTSGFKVIPIDNNLPDYEFEIRDQASGTMLTSFTVTGVNSDMNVSQGMIFQPFTLILSGHAGAAAPNEQKISFIKHRAS